MSESTIKAVIFDKDGTLHDTERVYAVAWRLAAEELNVPDIEATVQDCTGTTIPYIAAYWAKKYPTVSFDEYLPRRQYHFNRILEGGVPVKEGAHELLTYLRDHGYRIGMATSTRRDTVMEHLERSHMLSYFDKGAIITGDMVEHGKPAPDIFLRAADALGLSPSDCVGVEDSPNGVRAIHAARMRPVLIPDTVKPTPDVLALAWQSCRSLTDIIPILEAERR